MKPDFDRWRDGASDAPQGAAALLAQGRATPEIPDESKAKLDTFITSLASTGAAASASAARPWWAGATPKVVAIAAIVFGGAAYNRMTRAPDAQHATRSIAAPSSRSVETPATPPPALTPARPPQRAIDPTPAETPRIAVPTRPNATAPAAIDDSADHLAREVLLLDRARAQLESAPRRALAALEQHRAAHPRGALVEEREFLAIDALLRIDQRAAAEARARAFFRRYPSSAYTRRIRAQLEPTADRNSAP